MKVLITFISLLAVHFSHAEHIELESGHIVKSDSLVETIPEGKCRVFGKVLKDGKTAPDALISTISHGFQTKSDSKGNYSLLFDLSDTLKGIFCYHPSSEFEEVIWDYKFLNQHVVEIDFYLISVIERRPMKKPVIYFYSEEELSCTVKIIPHGDLTFTYPNYEECWKVSVSQEDGLMVNDQTYPYLFWEGEGKIEMKTSFDEVLGEIVSTDELVDYFEQSLTELGLNRKEQSDFITFWAPQLLSKEYVLIQWLVDEAYAKDIAELEVLPKPDHLRRIYLLASPIDDSQIKTKSQSLKSFERNEFTVVEWGGTIIPQDQIFKSL